ncbi:MAG: AzlD domain-containing protein [Firmicutes bacterium]|nr:AzlD domain-containing protein [Bacillota bacterium]
MTVIQAIISIAAIAVFTFLLRAAPFFLFSKGKTVPPYVKYMGSVLPFAVMGMLIVYSLKSVVITSFPYGLPEGIAILFVVTVQKWKHNLLISILGGTVLYMVLVQTVFAA